MEQKNVVMGVTKGTPLEKQMGIIADTEVRGTKQYYALARAAREQGLPEEIAVKLEEMADQESNHAGFYALLNVEAPVDVFAAMRKAAKPEYNAGIVLQPVSDKLRAMGAEKAAQTVETFIAQERHHGEMLNELLRKYDK
jgi:rubrerythrin